MFNFDSIKKAIQSIGSESARLQNQLEKLKQQREDVANAPMPRSELVSLLCAEVDVEAAKYPEALEGHAGRMRDNPGKNHRESITEMRLFHCWHGMTDKTRPNFAALAYLLGDQIKARLADAVNELEYPGPEGLPSAERQSELSSLDTQIEDLEKQLFRIREQTEAAGLVVNRFVEDGVDTQALFAGGTPTSQTAVRKGIDRARQG